MFDGFLINDELDLLELRLMELAPVVDTFVAVQMDKNLRGEPKPAHLKLDSDRWTPWLEKLKVLTITGREFGPHPEAEFTQRRLVATGFEGVEVGDLLMLSDVDEIPSRRVIDAIKEEGLQHPVSLIQRLYYYSVNLRMCRPWVGTVIWPHGCIRGDVDMQQIRNMRGNFPQIQDAGWHFSWMGDAEDVLRKLKNLDVKRDAAIFKGEIDKIPDDDDAEVVSDRVSRGLDLFARESASSTLIPVGIEPGIAQPHEIMDWLTRYPRYERAIV